MNPIHGLSPRPLWAVALVFALAVTACTGNAPTASSSPSTSVTAAPTATATASGPMTGAELVWLEGIATLHKAMDDTPSTVTSATMRTLADKLGGCTRQLTGLGSLTDRLQPVSDLAKQACGQYEKGGQCFATAADLGVISGSAEEAKYKEATDCAFAALGDGSKLFGDAEVKGFEIKAAAY